MEEEKIPETFSEKYPIIKKVLVYSIALFLLIIVIVYFLTNPQVRAILVGLIESETVNQNIVKLKSGGNLIFENQTYEELMQIYDNNPDKEFKVCLQGYTQEKDYLITSIFKPKMFLQTHSSVTAEPCQKDSLVSMHSHPLKHCLPSTIDLKNFERFKLENPNALMAIMCEKHRFNFYS